MRSNNQNKNYEDGGPVIVIVGPTGSGKTGIAVEIAKEIERRRIGGFLGAEIISADSRAVFKGMDLGTAKPTLLERQGVKHYGFDLVQPGERFTVKDWKDYAREKILEIQKEGKLPIVVGGTGFYIDALVFDYKFQVQGVGYDKNRGECIKNLNGKNGTVVQNDKDKYPDRQKMCSEYVVFGIDWNPKELKKRLAMRAEQMFCSELYEETRQLVKEYDWDNQAMKSDIYEFAWKYLEGELTREEAIRLTTIEDWHLAKRQLTWFKRNENILWLPLDKIKASVIKCIQDEQRK